MRGIGRGVREFNDAKTNVKNEIEAGMSDKDKKEQELKVQQAQASQMQQPQATHLQTELPK
jgi:Sec-independent protein translocase protein TatA